MSAVETIHDFGDRRAPQTSAMGRWDTTTLWLNVFVAGSYWGLAFLVKWCFSNYEMWPAPLWAPTGVALFAAFSLGRRTAYGIFVGALLSNMVTFHEHFILSAIVSAGDSFAPIIAAEMLRKRVRLDELFSKVRYLVYFGLCTLFCGVVSATIGVAAVWGTSRAMNDPIWKQWVEWVFSDVGAALLLTPVFLLWRRQPSLRRTPHRSREFLLSLVVAILAVLYLLFGTSGDQATDAGASFLLLLPLLWMAVRLSLRIAYPAFLAVMGATIAGTVAGYGPFAGVEHGGVLIIFAQMAIGFGASVLLLGAAANEQRASEQSLRKLNQELESRVELRTAALQASQERLEKAALYDSLTGLPNRRLLSERFAAGRAVGERAGDRLALLLVDLDRFKEINDRFGHDAGDALLVEIGCRLITSVRENDTVARLGGDEFAVLLSHAPDSAVIDTICGRMLTALSAPMSYHEQELQTSSSIGVAFFPEHGYSWKELYKAADRALYEAKRGGRNTFRYSSETTAQVKVLRHPTS